MNVPEVFQGVFGAGGMLAGYEPGSLEEDRSTIMAVDSDLRIAYCNRAWDHRVAISTDQEVKVWPHYTS